MKPLAIDDVRKAIYQLLAENDETTTLDVKNLLRNWNFMATQKDVSNYVNTIARTDQLASKNNGRFNTYYFGKDTQHTFSSYLERNAQFVEILLRGKAVHIYKGTVGTDGVEEVRQFPKNLLAYQEAQQITNFYKQVEGYVEAVDKRLPLAIRKRFGALLGKKATTCTLGYYNVLKKEQKGKVYYEKSAGYRFNWELAQHSTLLKNLLENDQWISKQQDYTSKELLGEKIIQQETRSEEREEVTLEVKRENLYEITLTFATGEQAVLSKFNLSLEKELLPLFYGFLDT